MIKNVFLQENQFKCLLMFCFPEGDGYSSSDSFTSDQEPITRQRSELSFFFFVLFNLSFISHLLSLTFCFHSIKLLGPGLSQVHLQRL